MIHSNNLVKILILLILVIYDCKESKDIETEQVNNKRNVSVFNFENKDQLLEYNKLNLDDSHPNLLNPKISKSKYEAVMKSWTDLHQRIGKYLSNNGFAWDVEDNSVTIVQKIYFNSKGEINYYFFNILNEKVTQERKEQFSNLILNFSKENKIDFTTDRKFAQCGKTKYLNQ